MTQGAAVEHSDRKLSLVANSANKWLSIYTVSRSKACEVVASALAFAEAGYRRAQKP